MLVLIALAFAGGIVAYAMWRVPAWIGVAHAAAGLVTYAVIGYLWLIALFSVPRLFELIVLALRRVHLDGPFALVVYFAPPALAALGTVTLLRGRRAAVAADGGDRMGR
jgi:hypothetical protein